MINNNIFKLDINNQNTFYNINAEIAKSICNKLDIEWDDNASIPTLNGKPITDEDIKRAFGIEV